MGRKSGAVLSGDGGGDTGGGTGGDTGGGNGEVKISEELQERVNTKTKKKRRLSSRELMLEMTIVSSNGEKFTNDVNNVSMTNPMRKPKKGIVEHAVGSTNNNTNAHTDWDNLKYSMNGKRGGIQGKQKQRAKRLSKVMKIMKEKEIEVLQDKVSGRRYSHNILTGGLRRKL